MTYDRNTAAVESHNAISAARVFQMPVELIAEASLEKLPIAFSMEVY